MKKIWIIVLSFVLAFSAFCPMTVTAASNTYDISALGVKVEVTIPEGYDVITRDTPSGDPIFSKFGTTSSVVFDEFEEYGIYLKAISSDNIVVTVSERVLDHFDLMSDTTVHGLVSQLERWYAKYRLNILDYRACHNPQLQYLEVYFMDPVRNISALQYYTVFNGRAVSFILYSNSVRIDEKQENTLKAVVNNSRISNVPTVIDSEEDAQAFGYTDTDAKVSFTVPANWKQKEFNEERELLDVKFVPTKEDGCSIIYGSVDMWEQMSAADRLGHSRSDINNSFFTKQDVAEIYGTTVDKISTTTYNGVQYFIAEINTSSDVHGVDVSMTQLVCFDNGWMYMFQFSGISTHDRYSDFEALLSSVKYPVVTNADRPELPDQDSLKSSIYHAAVIVLGVFVLLIIATVIFIAVATISQKKKKNMPQLDSSPTYHAPETQPVDNTAKNVACRKCGEKLIDNSRFCAQCGTVVEYHSEVDTPAPEAEKEEFTQQEAKPMKQSVKIMLLIVSLSLILLAGIVCTVLFLMGLKATPQDINTINGCPEFYNVEFGMTVGQASKVIEMKHNPIEGMESSSYFEVDEFMKSSHILFDEGEVFSLYGIEAASVYVSFDGKFVDAVMFTFDKEEVSYNKIADLYDKIYGPATTVSSSAATWIGPKTTIDVYDYEIFSDDGEKTIVVRYSITENSQYTTLSFDGPELDPCDFLGKNNAFHKKPSYYTNGLKKDDDYSYEQFSAGGFASFEKYTLYPRFEYMGIGKGYTAITFDKNGSEDTIGLVSYLFLLDQSNAVDRMSYIEKALTQKYGVYSSCTYTSTEYSALGIVDITFDELKQKVGSNTQGIYNVQWESNGRKITLGLTISADETYYDGSVAYTD